MWQIKRFATPLSNGQRQQVKRSWSTFNNAYVVPGTKIASYNLVTVWTPTENSLDWWSKQVVVDASFPTAWDGEAFFDDLGADFPEVVDRFVKGDDMLENMVTAKAIIAGSPVETGTPLSMLDATRTRDIALARVRDLVSDTYRIDTAIVSTGSAQPPPLSLLRPDAAGHRMTYIDDGRWHIESLVPRSDESARDDPITIGMKVEAQPGTPKADELQAWREWGVPLRGFPARVRQRGGPFGSDEWHDSSISMTPQLPDDPHELPDLVITDTEATHRVRFLVREKSHGTEGGGTRVVATTRSGIVRLEIRMGSSIAEGTTELSLDNATSRSPLQVASELRALQSIASSSGFQILVGDDEAILAGGTNLVPPPFAPRLLELATALTTLQRHTSQKLVMPDIDHVTVGQAADLVAYAGAYNREGIRSTWSKVTFTLTDPAGFAKVWDTHSDGYLVEEFRPELACGIERIEMDTPLVRTIRMPPMPPGLASMPPGSDVDFRPGDDDSVTIGIVVDDT